MSVAFFSFSLSSSPLYFLPPSSIFLSSLLYFPSLPLTSVGMLFFRIHIPPQSEKIPLSPPRALSFFSPHLFLLFFFSGPPPTHIP